MMTSDMSSEKFIIPSDLRKVSVPLLQSSYSTIPTSAVTEITIEGKKCASISDVIGTTVSLASMSA